MQHKNIKLKKERAFGSVWQGNNNQSQIKTQIKTQIERNCSFSWPLLGCVLANFVPGENPKYTGILRYYHVLYSFLHMFLKHKFT